LERLGRKSGVTGLDLLKTGQVGLGLLKLFEQSGESLVDAVHIESRELHPY
jgi:hypothetical protein